MIVELQHASTVRHAIASVQGQGVPPLCISVQQLVLVAGADADAACTAVGPLRQRLGGRASAGDDVCRASAADDLCWVYYTSGSSGMPKGVLCTHRRVSCFGVRGCVRRCVVAACFCTNGDRRRLLTRRNTQAGVLWRT